MKILCLDHNRPLRPRTCKEEEEEEEEEEEKIWKTLKLR
jgi:hypothetical protein